MIINSNFVDNYLDRFYSYEGVGLVKNEQGLLAFLELIYSYPKSGLGYDFNYDEKDEHYSLSSLYHNFLLVNILEFLIFIMVKKRFFILGPKTNLQKVVSYSVGYKN